MDVLDVLRNLDWQVGHIRELPGRSPRYVSWSGLPLAPATQRLLSSVPGLYQHQVEAVEAFLKGGNVCLTTGTASGKTLAFHACALEVLARDFTSRVAVLYPLKALSRQQEERWQSAMRACDLPNPHVAVGRIDGDTESSKRSKVLQNSRIVLFTPDIIHVWLMSHLNESPVKSFLRNLKLVIIDEAHTYTGVFGSNAAFLFRRLQHAVTALGGGPIQWFATSATIGDAERHLKALCGVSTRVIGSERDTSPRSPARCVLVCPPLGADLNTSLGRLFHALANHPTVGRFLAFVDSRRQVEALAVITKKAQAAQETEEDEAFEGRLPPKVMPYRSGYEEGDAAAIQRALQEGELRGVVSTSALELGLDIGDLDVGIQVRVPRSPATFLQRLGRIGRRREGVFIVVCTDSPYDQMVAQNPSLLYSRPLPTPTVYLENKRIQYIHAMCLAGAEGEADAVGVGEDWTPESGGLSWPEGFKELCYAERQGSLPPDLQGLKTDAGDDPWHTFPLRDAGLGFEIELRDGFIHEPLGSITHAQALREAYPGAVYYYMARPYRVQKWLTTQRKIVVTREKYYTTRPLLRPPVIRLNLSEPPLVAERRGNLLTLELPMQISEIVYGWEERRGSARQNHSYPTSTYTKPTLKRTIFTTGVALFHDALQAEGAAISCVCDALYEAFLLEIPSESADIAGGSGREKEPIAFFDGGMRYIALYDRIYGSLRLTGRLLHEGVLERCLQTARRLLEQVPKEPDAQLIIPGGRDRPYIREECDQAAKILDTLIDEVRHPVAQVSLQGIIIVDESPEVENGATVIMPGQIGLLNFGIEEEFVVESVFLHPQKGLMYKGRRVGESSNGVTTFVPIWQVRPIPGETATGVYNYDTGEVSEIRDQCESVG